MTVVYPALDESQFAESCRLFLHYSRVECGLAANSIISYERDFRAFAAFIGPECEIGEITGDDITAYIADLAERGLDPVSRARMFVSLRCFFRFCCIERIIPHDPSQYTDCPKVWRQDRKSVV